MWIVLTSATKKICFSKKHRKKHNLFYVMDFSPEQPIIVKRVVASMDCGFHEVPTNDIIESITYSFETMPFNGFSL